MSKETIHLAEVGVPATVLSPLGIPTVNAPLDYLQNFPLAVPRLVFFEPGIIGGHNQNMNYFEDLTDFQADGLNVSTIEHDVYDDQNIEDIPQIALMIFENVINDPSYLRMKEFDKLFNFLSQVITPHGLIMFIESILANENLDNKYRKFKPWLRESGLIVIEDNFQNSHTHNEVRREEVISFVTETMKELGTYDLALVEGLKNFYDKENRLLLLQQP